MPRWQPLKKYEKKMAKYEKFERVEVNELGKF